MLNNVPVPIRHQLEDRQAGIVHRVAESPTKRDPVVGSCMRRPEEPGGGRDIEPGRRAKERFEQWLLELLSLRQEGKDAATIVVEDHNRGVEFKEPCRKEPIEIMDKGEITDD